MRHIPEGFHADRLLRRIAAAQDAAPRPLASTWLGNQLVASFRTSDRQGAAPVNTLGLKRYT